MSFLFVSDLHVWGPEDPLYGSLLRIVRERAKPGDTLVLGGDVFDLWVGNKPVFRKKYSELIGALIEAGNRGVKIHSIQGNHDFLFERAFSGIRDMEVHGSGVDLDLDGKRFRVLHGDVVNRKDYGYRFLRAFFRSPVMKFLVAMAPGPLLEKIGMSSSHYSRSQKPALPAELPTARLEKLRNTYRSFAAEQIARGFDFVVMGHCHDLDEMAFQVGGRAGQYINIGFPRTHGSFLTWSPGESRVQREKLP